MANIACSFLVVQDISIFTVQIQRFLLLK